MIKNIDFVSIPFKDQKRAVDFYVNKLGFSVSTDQEFNEKQRWIELKIGSSQTRLVLFTPDGHEDRVGGFAPMTFACDDVQQTYDELRERGVEFMTPPRKEKWGMMAILKDSEGNQILISSK